MKKVVLMCAGGMSSSVLANKLKDAVKDRNLNLSVDFHATMDWDVESVDADIILLAPQVSYQLEELKRKFSCPIISIKPLEYGHMSVESLLNYISQNIEFHQI